MSEQPVKSTPTPFVVYREELYVAQLEVQAGSLDDAVAAAQCLPVGKTCSRDDRVRVRRREPCCVNYDERIRWRVEKDGAVLQDTDSEHIRTHILMLTTAAPTPPAKAQGQAVVPPEHPHKCGTYALRFAPEQWEEIEALAGNLFTVNADMPLPRYHWIALGHMAMGKAQHIEEGYYGESDEAEDYDTDQWAAQLREIAATIFAFFRPGDGQI